MYSRFRADNNNKARDLLSPKKLSESARQRQYPHQFSVFYVGANIRNSKLNQIQSVALLHAWKMKLFDVARALAIVPHISPLNEEKEGKNV